MKFGLKKLFRGAGKIYSKNKRGLGKLAKAGLKTGLSIAAPIVAAKVASVASGALERVVAAPARRKLNAIKKNKLSKVLQATIEKPSITMASSKETPAASNMPGGAPIRGAKGRKSSASAMPGGAPVSSGAAAVKARKGSPLGIAGTVGDFMKNVKRQQREESKARAAQIRITAKREKAQMLAAKRAAAKEAKARKALIVKAGRKQKRDAKEGSLVQNVMAGAIGAKATGKGTMAAKISRKAKSIARQTARKGVAAFRGSKAGAAAAAAGKAALRSGAGAAGLLGALTIGRARKQHLQTKAQSKSIRDTGKVLTTPMG